MLFGKKYVLQYCVIIVSDLLEGACIEMGLVSGASFSYEIYWTVKV